MTAAELAHYRERAALEGHGCHCAEDVLALAAEVERLLDACDVRTRERDWLMQQMWRAEELARIAQAEAERMKTLALRLSDRVVAQAELLSRQAEKTP